MNEQVRQRWFPRLAKRAELPSLELTPKQKHKRMSELLRLIAKGEERDSDAVAEYLMLRKELLNF